jgi:LysM repeat protein
MGLQRAVYAWRWVAVLIAGIALAGSEAIAQLPASAPAPASGTLDESDYILYQVRPGEDPSKIARMFHLTVDELLATNRISDPQRLVAGTMLKIPDPRAARLAELRTAKEAAERQVAAAQGTTAELQQKISTLETQVSELSEERDALADGASLSRIWRLGAFIAAATAIGVAFGALVLWAKAHDEAQRHRQAVKELEVLQIAVEKHRQLSGQFELRYQSLFHQVGLPAAVQTRAQALRQAYDEDRARLDAIVEEAEHAIKGRAAASPVSGTGKRSKAQVTALSAVRKNS